MVPAQICCFKSVPAAVDHWATDDRQRPVILYGTINCLGLKAKVIGFVYWEVQGDLYETDCDEVWLEN